MIISLCHAIRWGTIGAAATAEPAYKQAISSNTFDGNLECAATSHQWNTRSTLGVGSSERRSTRKSQYLRKPSTQCSTSLYSNSDIPFDVSAVRISLSPSLCHLYLHVVHVCE
ncbi:hypothetical protein FPOAC2_09444 [Fusarium poae]